MSENFMHKMNEIKSKEFDQCNQNKNVERIECFVENETISFKNSYGKEKKGKENKIHPPQKTITICCW